jgi:hypothetical protein
VSIWHTKHGDQHTDGNDHTSSPVSTDAAKRITWT